MSLPHRVGVFQGLNRSSDARDDWIYRGTIKRAVVAYLSDYTSFVHVGVTSITSVH